MASSKIIYKRGDQRTYRAIELHYTLSNRANTVVFNTGDPVVDYHDYFKFLSTNTPQFYQENKMVDGDDSWSHFFRDGKNWVERYFYPTNLRFLSTREFDRMTRDDYARIPRCIAQPFMSSFKHVMDHVNTYREKKSGK